MVLAAEDQVLGIERLGREHPLLRVKLDRIEDLWIRDRLPIAVKEHGWAIMEESPELVRLVRQLCR